MNSRAHQDQKNMTGLSDQLLSRVIEDNYERDLLFLTNKVEQSKPPKKETEVRGFSLSLAEKSELLSSGNKYVSAFISILEISGFLERKDRKTNFETAYALFNYGIPTHEKITWNHQHTDSGKYTNLTWLQLYYLFDLLLRREIIEADEKRRPTRTSVLSRLVAFFKCASDRTFEFKNILDAVNKYAPEFKEGGGDTPVGIMLVNEKLKFAAQLLTELNHAIFTGLG